MGEVLLLPERTKKTIGELKEEYVEYYADVPVQKYAAMSIARNEDTIIRWRKEDQDFADAVQRAHATWVRKKVLATRAEYALERIEKEIFSERSTVKLETSAYDRYVQENTIDPNTPQSKQLAKETLDILLARSKRVKATT